MHWRRKWQPTPVFLPGESQGWGSLVGCRLWGCTESDTTAATQQQQQQLPTNVGDAGDSGLLLGSGIPWRKKWQPTPVLLPGKFHGQRSLAGYSPFWGHKDSDTTEHMPD